MSTVRWPPGSPSGEERHGRAFDADTLRWAAGGELRWCACPECWSQIPFWRYVDVLREHWRRERPQGTRADFGAFVWDALAAPAARRIALRVARPAVARAARALRDAAAAGGWHLAELYEIVMRGAAQNWPYP